MRLAMFALVMFLCVESHARKLTVAIIDTGFDMASTWSNADKNGLTQPKICKFGHYDFENKTPNIKDIHGHGTHIAGLIAKGNEDTDYCIVVFNYYGSGDTMESSLKAYRRAIDIRVDLINYSGGGNEYSKEECALMKEALDAGIVVVAAAGNNGQDLDINPYYPANCDNRIKVVMSTDKYDNILPSSNYSTKKYSLYKRLGYNVMSLGLKNTYALMTGTSQATAVLSSEILKQMGEVVNTKQSFRSCSFDMLGNMKCKIINRLPLKTEVNSFLRIK
jgi:subtilisin family serine protease